MSPRRIIGLPVLVAGIVVLILGLNASNSLAEQVSETFTGRFTRGTTWYIMGAIAAGVLGLLMVGFSGRGSRSAKWPIIKLVLATQEVERWRKPFRSKVGQKFGRRT